jgi:hypothetical protein
MRLQPLEQWICDACGQRIESPQDGWIEWLAGSTPGTKAHGFRIVHNSNLCQYPSTGRVHDMHLEHAIGPDGLVALLGLLAPGRRSGILADGVTSVEEWAMLVRRLHVPYLEEARQDWAEAEADGFFKDVNEASTFSQATLLAIIERYANGGSTPADDGNTTRGST